MTQWKLAWSGEERHGCPGMLDRGDRFMHAQNGHRLSDHITVRTQYDRSGSAKRVVMHFAKN